MSEERETHQVRYSDLGLARLRPTNRSRVGEGYLTDTYYMVKWHGLLGFQAYAKTYIERKE